MEPTRLREQRVKHMLRDLADAPFVALVIPEDGDVKVYVKGVPPEKLSRIQALIERILREPLPANPDEAGVPRCDFDRHIMTGVNSCECGAAQRINDQPPLYLT